MEYWTATQLAAELKARTVSSTEALERQIARIEAQDDQINAVVVRDFERAREAAKAADAAIAAGDGRPLLGVPMTVKEAFNVEGLPTTWGLPGTQDIPIEEDAVVVQRLKAAGAIIIGKTNVPTMLADWQTANEVFGVTRNPWDLARTPGGSSGGGAAALAAGFTPLEYGSDLPGSLRSPAHACGVYAHKPSYGLTPGRGFAPPGAPVAAPVQPVDLAVLGPMARSAGDLALALTVTAGPDVPEAVGYRLALPPARHATLRDHRVLVLTEHPVLPTDGEIASAVDDLATRLEGQGCGVGRTDARLPDLGEATDTFVELLMAMFGEDGEQDHGPSHAAWLATDRRRYALAGQLAAVFSDWDVILCPAMPTTALTLNPPDRAPEAVSIAGRHIAYEMQPLWATLAGVTGNPATVSPVGLDSSGLPIGVQIIGPYLEDYTPIGFAGLLERAYGGFQAPPFPWRT